MPLVKVKDKYQVTLPAAVRQQAGLVVGDLLEVEVKGKKITLTPKSVMDRELALALKDYEKGRFPRPLRDRQGGYGGAPSPREKMRTAFSQRFLQIGRAKRFRRGDVEDFLDRVRIIEE